MSRAAGAAGPGAGDRIHKYPMAGVTPKVNQRRSESGYNRERMLRAASWMFSVALSAVLPGFAQVSGWQIDSAHTAAQFSVRHMMVSNVRGQFGKTTGGARFDPKDPAKATVEASVDVASIDTREPRRDAHLKSADFFDVQKFPAMTFRSKRVEAAGAGRLKLVGDLTMHGVTREVTLDVEGPTPEIKDARGGGRIGAVATARISRKEFGMSWNRAIEAGGVVVGDEVAITIDVELVRKP
jgi:polyisoprenoid-binding protein YceI